MGVPAREGGCVLVCKVREQSDFEKKGKKIILRAFKTMHDESAYNEGASVHGICIRGTGNNAREGGKKASTADKRAGSEGVDLANGHYPEKAENSTREKAREESRRNIASNGIDVPGYHQEDQDTCAS